MKDNQLFIADVIRRTDRDTLIELCDRCHIDYQAKHAGYETGPVTSIVMSNRRFFFGANGDIVRIIDYQEDTTSDAKGTKRANLQPKKQIANGH